MAAGPLREVTMELKVIRAHARAARGIGRLRTYDADVERRPTEAQAFWASRTDDEIAEVDSAVRRFNRGAFQTSLAFAVVVAALAATHAVRTAHGAEVIGGALAAAFAFCIAMGVCDCVCDVIAGFPSKLQLATGVLRKVELEEALRLLAVDKVRAYRDRVVEARTELRQVDLWIFRALARLDEVAHAEAKIETLKQEVRTSTTGRPEAADSTEPALT